MVHRSRMAATSAVVLGLMVFAPETALGEMVSCDNTAQDLGHSLVVETGLAPDATCLVTATQGASRQMPDNAAHVLASLEPTFRSLEGAARLFDDRNAHGQSAQDAQPDPAIRSSNVVKRLRPADTQGEANATSAIDPSASMAALDDALSASNASIEQAMRQVSADIATAMESAQRSVDAAMSAASPN